MYRHMYAYPHIKATKKVWTLYVLGAFLVTTVILAIHTIWALTYIGSGEDLQNADATYYLLFFIAVFIINIPSTLISTALIILWTRRRGLEEFLNSMWDSIRDGKKNRAKFVISILMKSLITIPAIIIFGFVMMLIVYLLYLAAYRLVDLFTSPDAFVTVPALLVGIAIPVYAVRRYHQKSSERKEEIVEQAESTTVAEHKITSYVPGFIGQADGAVIALEEQQILYNRSREIVDIVYKPPYLLVRDSKNTLFLWRFRIEWTFIGTLRRIGEDSFEFIKEWETWGKFTPTEFQPEVTKIREVGPKLLLQVDGTYHIVDDIGTNFNTTPLKGEDVQWADGQVILIREENGELLFSTKEREYPLGSSEGVKFVHVSSVIYVCRRDTIDIYNYPPTRKEIKIEFGARGEMRKVWSDQGLLIQASGIGQEISEILDEYGDTLMFIEPEGILNIWRVHNRWRFFYFKDKKYHIAVNKQLVVIDEQALQDITLQKFGEDSKEVVWGMKYLTD